jgi:hypothetical protein
MEKPPLKIDNHENSDLEKQPKDIVEETLNTQEPGNEYTQRREMVADKLRLEDAVKRAIEKTNDSYLKILGSTLLSNKVFIENKYGYLPKEGREKEFEKLIGGAGNGFTTGFESVDDPRIIIHEAIHVYTNPILMPNESELNPNESEIRNKIKEYFDIATENAKDEYYYGLTNEFEFISELSNKKFVSFLESIYYENESLKELPKEVQQPFINSLKNPYLKNFEIVSDLKKTDDKEDYYYTLRFDNGTEQNQYFKTEAEAELFFKRKKGEYDTNNLAFAVLNQFSKLVKVVESLPT